MTPILKTLATGAVLAMMTAAASPSAAQASQQNSWQVFGDHQKRHRQGRVSVESRHNPRLAQTVERHLQGLLRSSYGRTAPIHIQLGNARINPRLRIHDRQRVQERLGRQRYGFGKRDQCGRESLVYDAVRGEVRASYKLRYDASSRAFRPFQAKAKGKVRDHFQTASNARIVSRCGGREANRRDIRHLAGYDQRGGKALKARRIIQDALAQDIAREIVRDLRHHMPRPRVVQYGNQRDWGRDGRTQRNRY